MSEELIKAGDVTIDYLLKVMVDNKGSDLHLQTNATPMIRVKGDLVRLAIEPLPYNDMYRVIQGLLSADQINEFWANKEIDTAYSSGDIGRFRVNGFFQRTMPGLVIRTIGSRILTIEELGLPDVLRKIADAERGLILVTGATGSGKSTTLAAMIDYINATKSVHIMTIEDPIEFVHRNQQALVNQREVGADTATFKTALKYVLRQDPDIILVGEMRDAETMEIALTAAETGHLVFGTLHTIDTSQSIERIINFFPTEKLNQIRMQLSLCLQAIISQRLVAKQDGTGRTAALEILIASPVIRKALHEGETNKIPGFIQAAQQEGMQTFNQALVKLYNEGVVSFDDALASASKPDEFRMNAQGIYSGTSATRI